MERVSHGVYQATKGYVNAYLIDGDEGVTLVDSGLPNKEGHVFATLGSIGRSVDDLKVIVITHGHADHFGSAAAIKAESGAHLVSSEIDAPTIRGEREPQVPPFAEKLGFLKPILRMLPTPTGVAVDQTLSGDEAVSLVPDMIVMQTPGHTDGHISLLLERDGGILFVGDAAVADKSGTVKRGFMNAASETFDNSLRKIASHDFETAYFGHAAPIMAGASSAFARFVETI